VHKSAPTLLTLAIVCATTVVSIKGNTERARTEVAVNSVSPSDALSENVNPSLSSLPRCGASAACKRTEFNSQMMCGIRNVSKCTLARFRSARTCASHRFSAAWAPLRTESASARGHNEYVGHTRQHTVYLKDTNL